MISEGPFQPKPFCDSTICGLFAQFAQCCAEESTKAERLPQTLGDFLLGEQKTAIPRTQNNKLEADQVKNEKTMPYLLKSHTKLLGLGILGFWKCLTISKVNLWLLL